MSKKTVSVVAPLVLVIVLAVVILSEGQKFTSCKENTFITSMNDTTGYIAKGIVKDCGATTDYSTQFFIERHNDVSESVVILKGDYSSKCNISWDGLSIEIYCGADSKDVFSLVNSYQDVKVNLK